MFTRCPGCHTVHPVNAALLAQGNGLYRCGKCNKVSNALQNLFDHWPEAGESPSSARVQNRQPPVLSSSLDLEGDSSHDLPADESDLPGLEGLGTAPGSNTRGRNAWAAAAVVLVAVTLLNLFFVSGDALMARPTVQAMLQGIGAIDSPPEPKFRNLDLLHLASSEMHSHPTLEETLVLTATIVNRADRQQPYPDLQITLFDAQNQTLASRIFAPEEYLPRGSTMQSGMPPGAYLPVVMELLDPGNHATGFVIKFH